MVRIWNGVVRLSERASECVCVFVVSFARCVSHITKSNEYFRPRPRSERQRESERVSFPFHSFLPSCLGKVHDEWMNEARMAHKICTAHKTNGKKMQKKIQFQFYVWFAAFSPCMPCHTIHPYIPCICAHPRCVLWTWTWLRVSNIASLFQYTQHTHSR